MNVTKTIRTCLGTELDEQVGTVEVDIFIGLVLLTCFLFGTLGNITAFVYFFRETGNMVLLHIYKFVAFADIAKSVLILPMVISYFVRRQQMVFTGVILCTFWTTLFMAFSQVAIFLVAVLNICRTMFLLNPSRVMNPDALLVTMTFVAIGILVINLSPAIVWNLTAIYNRNKVTCGWYTSEVSNYEDLPHTLINALFTGIPLSLMIPIVISFILNIHYSFYKNVGSSESIPPSTRKNWTVHEADGGEFTSKPDRSSKLSEQLVLKDPTVDQFSEQTMEGRQSGTITILILTITYLIFNVPILFAFFIDAADGLVDRCLSLLRFDFPHNYLANYVYTLSIPLNSLANFLIFLIRMPRFRKGIEDQGQKGLSKVKV